ncbi:MAG TPA: hypothetical protein VNH39_07855 [Steroidobacteraceae bacterium]|nr:hypothetical protein [Steroidobacteraceae bacterium]
MGLMFADPYSYLSEDPNWKPAGAKPYTLKDFVKFAIGQRCQPAELPLLR